MSPESLRSAGWTSREADGFSGTIAPYWYRGKGVDLEIGFIVKPEHSNNRSTLHGGALMTFVDIGLGSAASAALGHSHCVTAQLQAYFVSAARVGDFVTCRPEVVRKTSQMVFVRGLICVGDKTVASGDGIWKVLSGEPEGRRS
jgi:acyl-coenzyme A thioesterase PaaI-like protein